MSHLSLASLPLATAALLAAVGCADAIAAPDPSGVRLPPQSQRHFSCAVRVRHASDDLASPRWHQITRDLVTKYRTDPSARPYALVSLAQYAAVVSAQDRSTGGCPSSRAAVAGASAAVLTYLYPAEAGTIAAALAAQQSADAAPAAQRSAGVAALVENDPGVGLPKHDDAAALSAGEQIGREAAQLVIAYARADGSSATWTGAVPAGPGYWFSSATPPAPVATPILAQTRPYFLTTNSQFRPAPPPGFGSPEFLAALAEVKSVTAARTPDQLAIAKEWSLSGGTYRLQGHWNLVGAGLAAAHGLREREATHALALLGMAMHDASVACWDAKLAYWLIRPSQVDPTISVGISLSNHPSYPSSHACTAGAADAVLGALFGEDAGTLTAMADEIALSRLYGGVHYRFDNDTGLAMGRAVGGLAIGRDIDLAILGTATSSEPFIWDRSRTGPAAGTEP